MNGVPTTPTRSSIKTSLIPSPNGMSRTGGDNISHAKRRYTSSPPHSARTISHFQNDKRNTIHPRLPQSESVGSNSSSSNDSTSNLTKFYKSNVLELNELQETLFKKKSILDSKNDEYETYKFEQQEIQIKWDKIIIEKQKIENELKLKQKELQRYKESNIEKKKILEKGHSLQLKELEAKHHNETNKLRNEYDLKIEKLKHDKIKEFETKRNNLLNEVEEKRNNILMNDSILNEMKQEIENKYIVLKEEWLKSYQSDWKQEIEINETASKDIITLQDNINEKLNPEIEILTKRLDESKQKFETLQKILDERTDATKDLVSKIEEKTKQIKDTQDRSENLIEKIDEIKDRSKVINNELIKEETVRRTLHNKLQELRGNIRVYCRLRPPSPKENLKTDHLKVEKFDDSNGTQSIEVVKPNNTSGNNFSQVSKFKFDKIFDQNDDNYIVFNEVGQLVQSALDGYNVCIFAYGQTGSGKTFTMLNQKDGIIPLTITHIFNWTENLKERGWKYKITCQFIEIYNENIVDLLRKSHPEDNGESNKHEIRHDMETQTTSVTNVTTCELDCEDTVNNILYQASKVRSTASTGSNEHSSRSHSIFIIHLEGENSKTGEKSEGILNLIDLAGSERINISQVTGERLRETQYINKSLSCLGDVIHALNDSSSNKRHIPFRNSKLTYLLQNSLVGNSKTLMFVNISSASNHINETLNSLRFASKVNATKMGRSL